LLKGPSQLDERVPMEVGSIQVNFCKNPQCQNFGVPASGKRQPRGKGASERGRNMVGKLLNIFRVFYNFEEIGKTSRLRQCGWDWQRAR
jgi:hypothetical protein